MKEKTMTSMQKYEADYKFADRATTGNCALVRQSKVCGCLYCGNIFMADRAVLLPEFGDEGTVLCPHCSCDAVIPDAAGEPINPETLDRIANAFYHYHDDDAEFQKATREFAASIFGGVRMTEETGSEKPAQDDETPAITVLEPKPRTTGEELFVEAMLADRWDVVLKLVEFGFKPGGIRHTDVADCLSALGLALEAGEYEVAEKLYEAGDRLDDYCHHVGKDMKPSLLTALSLFRRSGCDLFRDDHATLADCCAKGLLLQAEPLVGPATRKELDEALHSLLDGFLSAAQAFGYAGLADFMQKLIDRGGELCAEDRKELLGMVGRLEQAPHVGWWHIDGENAAKFRTIATGGSAK